MSRHSECDDAVERLNARIAALESELAAKGRDYEDACRIVTERTEDRDRERSRREALEREVRELRSDTLHYAKGVAHWLAKSKGEGRECGGCTGCGDDSLMNSNVCVGAGWIASKPILDKVLRAILDRSAEQTKGGDAIAGNAAQRSQHVAQTEPDSTSDSVDAEQDEPHTPDAEPVEPRYPCNKCGELRTKAEGGTTFTVCDACWDALHPKEPEPSMSVSEAHVDALLRTERSNVWDDAALICKERGQWLLALNFGERAAAVRRGEA